MHERWYYNHYNLLYCLALSKKMGNERERDSKPELPFKPLVYSMTRIIRVILELPGKCQHFWRRTNVWSSLRYYHMLRTVLVYVTYVLYARTVEPEISNLKLIDLLKVWKATMPFLSFCAFRYHKPRRIILFLLLSCLMWLTVSLKFLCWKWEMWLLPRRIGTRLSWQETRIWILQLPRRGSSNYKYIAVFSTVLVSMFWQPTAKRDTWMNVFHSLEEECI